MNKQSDEDQEILIASRIGASVEQFDSEYSVLSVSLEILIEGEEQVLSLQREFGTDADEPDQVCVVLSPSQVCAYDPLKKLILNRNSLTLKFTKEAEQVFGALCVKIEFSVPDKVFTEFREKLEILCEGHSFYNYTDNAI